MLRHALTRCPSCDVRSQLSRKLFASSPIQWQQARSLRQDQHRRPDRKPSRMVLSTEVAESTTTYRPRTPNGPKRKKSGDPFGHLNLRRAPQSLTARAQQKDQDTRTRTRRGRDEQITANIKTHKKEKGSQKGRELFHAMKMQRALATVPYNERMKVKSSMMDVEAFDEFPLLSSIKSSIPTQALPGLTDLNPSPVQKVAIPALLGSDGQQDKKGTQKRGPQQFLIAAETGSGKTLSYLLPVIDAMKRNEAEEKKRLEEEALDELAKQEAAQENSVFDIEPPKKVANRKDTARPRVIILVPTAELVDQVGALAKSLSHTIKYKAALISSSYTPTVIRNRLFAPSGIDMLICTPHLLSSLSESSPQILSRVTHLVIDEADSLLDRSFAPVVEPIIDRSTPSLQQLILCSATIPRSLDSYLRNHYPDIRRITTPNLHAIPRRVQLGIVEVENDPWRGNKNLACADTIWNIGRSSPDPREQERIDVKRILVFVNEREKAVEVADFLVSKGIDAMALNRDTDIARRDAILASFRAPSVTEANNALDILPGNYVPPVQNGKSKSRRLINAKVLVCTDLGSRGIDTLACRHVILYDVPHTSIDFIHRLGRTGRMGRRGRGVVLVGKGDRKDVVREVREAMFKGQAMI